VEVNIINCLLLTTDIQVASILYSIPLLVYRVPSCKYSGIWKRILVYIYQCFGDACYLHNFELPRRWKEHTPTEHGNINNNLHANVCWTVPLLKIQILHFLIRR